MSSRRRKRRAAERRLEREASRRPIGLWTLLLVAAIVIAFGIARIWR